MRRDPFRRHATQAPPPAQKEKYPTRSALRRKRRLGLHHRLQHRQPHTPGLLRRLQHNLPPTLGTLFRRRNQSLLTARRRQWHNLARRPVPWPFQSPTQTHRTSPPRATGQLATPAHSQAILPAAQTPPCPAPRFSMRPRHTRTRRSTHKAALPARAAPRPSDALIARNQRPLPIKFFNEKSSPHATILS